MEVVNLKDIFIAMDELERYFDGIVPVNLWRGLNVKRNVGLFDLIEAPFKMSNGKVRKPDLVIEHGWVKVKHWPRGVSTFDKPGVPKGKDWVHYKIPSGTRLPNGLAIVKDSYNESFSATHYTIAPAHDMPIEKFRMLLKLFAAEIERLAK
ncbi:Tse2 family ADP-ribosyltransferase toxin [Sessilibacter sp. MAH4]